MRIRTSGGVGGAGVSPAPTRSITRPEYLAINPKGKVPTLIIDRVRFTETPAIVTHLARTYPGARLLPNRRPISGN